MLQTLQVGETRGDTEGGGLFNGMMMNVMTSYDIYKCDFLFCFYKENEKNKRNEKEKKSMSNFLSVKKVIHRFDGNRAYNCLTARVRS